MRKIPSDDIFKQDYAEFNTRREAVKILSERYGVKEPAVYRRIRKLGLDKVTPRRANNIIDLRDIVQRVSKKTTDGEYRNVKIDLPNEDVIIVFMSDMHIGSRFTNMKRFLSDIETIASTPNVYIMVLGDILDAGGLKTTPHIDLMFDQIMSVSEAKYIATQFYKKLHDRILVSTSGCHGAWEYADTGEYFEEELAGFTDTGLFIDHGGTVDVMVGMQPYKIFITHKLRGGSDLNPTRGIMKLHEKSMDFDIGVAAHHHVAAISVMSRRGKSIYAIKCGSYKGLDTFANKNGFVSTPMFIPGVKLSSETRKIIPYIDWRDAL